MLILDGLVYEARFVEHTWLPQIIVEVLGFYEGGPRVIVEVYKMICVRN